MSTLPLLLAPGLMCDDDCWADLRRAMQAQSADEARREVRVIDHGMADSLPRMAEQILAEAPPRFALAGHSMGGRVALEVWRRAPERVTHLALLNTGAVPLAQGEAGERERTQRLGLLDVARTEGVAAMARQWVQAMVAPARLHGDPALVERIVAMLARKTPDHFERQQHALLNRPDARPVLPTITAPTLLLSGEEDGWSPPAPHEAMRLLMPEGVGRLVVVPRAGHMAPMEQADEVARAFIDWLKR
jgi:pimeloyl-ACP methyl ester carboxylesterase